MASRTGYVGSRGGYTSFAQIEPQDIDVNLQATEYPTSIDIALHTGSQDPTDDCYFRNRYTQQLAINLYLTDYPNHNFEIQLGAWTIPAGGTDGTVKHFTISKTDALKLRNKRLGLEMKNTAPSGSGIDSRTYTELYGRAAISVQTDNDSYFTLTPLAVGTDGYVNVSTTKPAYNSEVTLTPVPSAGYYLSSYTITADAGGTVPTVTNHKFRMPANDLTVKGNFSKYTYLINKGVNISGAGTVTTSKTSAQIGDSVTVSQTPATGYTFTGWTTSPENLISNNAFTMPASNVTVTANYAKTSYTITKAASPSGGGTVTTSKATANYQDTITLTATPATGYTFTGWTTSPSVTVQNNAFTMPASNITVTANFAKINYTISKSASPNGAGTITTSKTTANYGDSVTVSQTAATGYYFNGWTTSPANLISNGAFTMPASNVTITANYLKRSTASLSVTTLTGNSSATLTISADKTTYSHKYKLSFGTNMETALTNVAAGTSKVTISIPDSWSNYIPSATTKTGGTLIVYTYNGNTQIGSYTITGLTYAVRSTAVPTIGTITTSISTSYTTWSLYIQNKCGVRIQTSASGVLSSTIASLRVYVNGYSGANYDKTVYTGSIDFTTGMLSVSGTNTITVIATDSRGRTASKTTTIDVKKYSSPTGTLSLRRVDSGGTDDDMGEYGKFTLTKSYTAVGSNSLTVKLTSQGTQVTITGTSGDLLPNNRQTFSIQQEYTITMTLQDAFETVTITGKLRSAKFIIYVNANGKKLGFMKATNKGGANDKTIEFDADSMIYIGDMTLAQYIQSVVNNM